MTRRILVAYASRHGGTEEIAQVIARELRQSGCVVDYMRAVEVESLARYDAVVIGCAIYAGRWMREATRFVNRHASDLRARRVWMFSCGPLDGSASQTELAPVPTVAKLMAKVEARGHRTFGGHLAPDAKGFIASRMAKAHAGDWRDWEPIRAWAHEIAEVIQHTPRTAGWAHRSVARPRLAALCLVTGITAIGGGLALAIRPDGSLLHARLADLEHTPFASYLIPGLLLLLVVGLGNTMAGLLAARRSEHADTAGFLAGAVLAVWTLSELVLLRNVHWLQLVYLVIAAATIAEAVQRLKRSALDVASS